MIERDILRKYLEKRGRFISQKEARVHVGQLRQLSFLFESAIRSSGVDEIIERLYLADAADTDDERRMIADVVAEAARRVVMDRRAPDSVH